MKFAIPNTRNSLIARLPDKADQDAWNQFVEIYDPLIHRIALSKGFQDADAREIVQEVLLVVSRAVERWKPDAERGRFRDWLFCIARNLMINFLTRRKHRSIASGDSRIAELLDAKIDPSSEESAAFDWEYRRQLFRFVAEQVKARVTSQTWQAFWRTSVDGESIGETASDLKMSTGAVHIARSRVLGRLRAEVSAFEKETPNASDVRLNNGDPL